MEKFYQKKKKKKEEKREKFHEALNLQRCEIYVRTNFHFLQTYRAEPDTHTHTQDSTEPPESEMIHRVSKSKELCEKLQIERERWQRTICVRSTREWTIERDMYNSAPTIPFIVDDYIETALDLQVEIFCNMLGYRYGPWKWCLVNSNAQPNFASDHIWGAGLMTMDIRRISRDGD
ncbi:hypothetical protein BELL_0012g00060 [Botrytis elliptica]|uniref:Uncharacterized protein n=1 Tax=Botrytis elliptica TaxID=278938 RepID=A0A4Z1K3A1_9HELO|nr:hypothetical protein BELL_0012g00060 [Botrytis elliptica]